MEASGQDSSPIALLLGIDQHPVQGFFLLYIVITILSIIVYKLGFAKKLPILKSAVIYTFLVIGCFPLTLFGIGLPVAEGLIVAALILIIYKVRLYQSKKAKNRSMG
ncbi:YlaH-like family protein [Fictibacillus sp. Mic-4]|uniref:YlaH-like family protein n=1 Tax=Fictibacillus TaxID=1329200 RepID=UPI00047D8F24|nr:YlaH-like family protein [Fictibacillus gelatini]